MSQTAIRDRLFIELGISAEDTAKAALADNALWQAAELIKEKRRTAEVEPRFEHVQFQIAVRIWNIRGIEGEISHGENGITRSYRSDGQIADLLQRVLPPVIVG